MEDNMVGKQYGKLTVVREVDPYVAPSGGKHKKYECLCSCGKTAYVLKEYLTSGRQKSCGCLKKENGITTHGEIHTRLYRIWGNMCNRCTNPSNPAWHNYGDRGIKVCDDWLRYENFRDWANSSGYTENVTIDRIDNNKGYSPDNCRWADLITQANNKRNNHIIEYNGTSMTIAEWAVETGIPYKTLFNRFHLGWSAERALTQPMRKSPCKHNKPNTMDG